MSLSRLAVPCVLVAAATWSFAASPDAEPVASNLSTSLESVRLVPWFTGMHALNPQIQTEERPRVLRQAGERQILPMLSEIACLKLRTYRVKRQETFSEGESGSIGYSNCQQASNYQLRSTVEIKTFQAGSGQE